MRRNSYNKKRPFRYNKKKGTYNKGFTFKKPAFRYSIPNPGALQISNMKEKKTCDLPVQSNVISATAVLTPLNLIQQGSGFYNRIGQKVMMRSLRITGQIVINPSSEPTGVSEYFRVMVVYDRQVNGALPSIQDILGTYDNTGSFTCTSLSHLNMTNAERFMVVMDIRYDINTNISEGVYGPAFDVFINSQFYSGMMSL